MRYSSLPANMRQVTTTTKRTEVPYSITKGCSVWMLGENEPGNIREPYTVFCQVSFLTNDADTEIGRSVSELPVEGATEEWQITLLSITSTVVINPQIVKFSWHGLKVARDWNEIKSHVRKNVNFVHVVSEAVILGASLALNVARHPDDKEGGHWITRTYLLPSATHHYVRNIWIRHTFPVSMWFMDTCCCHASDAWKARWVFMFDKK